MRPQMQVQSTKVLDVINALHKRACGFTEEIVTKNAVPAANDQVLYTIQTKTKYHPPDVAAITFFLTNQLPKHWSKTPNVDISDDELKRIEISFVNPENAKD